MGYKKLMKKYRNTGKKILINLYKKKNKSYTHIELYNTLFVNNKTIFKFRIDDNSIVFNDNDVISINKLPLNIINIMIEELERYESEN